MDDAMVLPLAPRIAADLGPFLLLTSEDTLTLVLDTIAAVIDTNKGNWLTANLTQALVDAIFKVWENNNKGERHPSFLSFYLLSLFRHGQLTRLTRSHFYLNYHGNPRHPYILQGTRDISECRRESSSRTFGGDREC